MALERSGGSRPEDTALTKIFVGGLAWETRRDGLRAHFEKFGEVKDAIVVTDGITGRSRGYGFVTFKDAEAARKACEDPFPVIDGRRTNCNLSSLGDKKNRPYTPSPHPGWEKWRRRSGPSSRLNPGFHRVAPPSPHIQRPRTWEARTFPTYQYPAYSYSLHTMNYYNAYGGQHLPTYHCPQYLNSYPLHQHYGQPTLGTTHYRKSGHYPVLYTQFSSTSIPGMPLPAVTGRGSATEEDKVQQHQRELTKNSLLDEDNQGTTSNSQA